MSNQWFEILQAAKSLSKAEKAFTASELASAAAIDNAPLSTREKVAYGWISKFLRWGYLRRASKIPGSQGRLVTTYKVTDSGMLCEEREGKTSQLNRLILTIMKYGAKRGTKGEEKAWEELVYVMNEVAPESK